MLKGVLYFSSLQICYSSYMYMYIYVYVFYW